MEPLPLLNEDRIRSFFKSSTIEDVKVYFNSVVTINRHIDGDNKLKRVYSIRLTDTEISPYTYEVTSNAIGLEALTVIARRCNVENRGSESENSKFIGLYSELE